jgi:BolA protein
MKINELIEVLDKKLKKNFKISSLKIEDKSFLHAKHKSFKEGKFHIKLILISDELKLLKSIDSNKKIYAVLKEEMNNHIHSLQIKIN